MKLKKLELTNFRGFRSLSLAFHPQITVIVGINGSGKTSILDAVARELGKITGQDTGLMFEETDCRIGSSEAEVKLIAEFEDQEIMLHHLVADGKDTKGTTTKKPSFLHEQLNDGPLPLLAYYSVARHAVDETPGPLNPRSWNASNTWHNSLSQTDASFQSFFLWFRDREDLENEALRDNSNHVDSQLKSVREAISLLLPGFTKPRIRRQPKPVLTVIKEGQTFVFNQLSEGERTLAALGCDIARRLAIANPKSDHPLDGEGVVLIDEIDLHLHPQWQRNIIPALQRTFPNIQFVVTTHSPIVLSYVDTDSVRLIEDFNLVEKLPPTRGREPNSLITDIFGQNLRPDDVDDELEQLSNLIDSNDLISARSSLDALRSKLGGDDPEVVRYGTMIDFLDD